MCCGCREVTVNGTSEDAGLGTFPPFNPCFPAESGPSYATYWALIPTLYMQTGACAAWQKHGSSCVGFRLPAGYGREATGYVRLGYVTGVFSFISGVSNVGARGLGGWGGSLRSSIVSTTVIHNHFSYQWLIHLKQLNWMVRGRVSSQTLPRVRVCEALRKSHCCRKCAMSVWHSWWTLFGRQRHGSKDCHTQLLDDSPSDGRAFFLCLACLHYTAQWCIESLALPFDTCTPFFFKRRICLAIGLSSSFIPAEMCRVRSTPVARDTAAWKGDTCKKNGIRKILKDNICSEGENMPYIWEWHSINSIYSITLFNVVPLSIKPAILSKLESAAITYSSTAMQISLLAGKMHENALFGKSSYY